ncbi:hypothetical protein [Micromonospora sp. CPCC 205556]|uniref:hypothetical protein n=1 Tax=Micromonospora sp. CPCC 205556 TaxID=3122398 RepID=UPI002FF252E4
MELYGVSVMQLAGELPYHAVLVTGLVLVATRADRLPRRARLLTATGAAVLLVAGLVTLAWNIAIPHLLDSGWLRNAGFGRLSLLGVAVSAAAWVGYPVGTGLLIGAVFAGRRPVDPSADAWGAWTPPTTDADATPAAAAPATTPWGGTDRPPAAPTQD